MIKGEITLRVVHKSEKQACGGFEAAYYNEEGKCRSKQAGLHVNEPDIAYEIVDLWAEDKAKEFGLKYVKVSKKELLERIELGANRKTPTQAAKLVVNKSNLNNKKYFKDEIKRQFVLLGYDRVKDVLKEGTAYLNELERERNKVAQNTGKAKSDMAKAMYLSFIDTGVDMSIYCNDEEIINEFNKLKADSASLI